MKGVIKSVGFGLLAMIVITVIQIFGAMPFEAKMVSQEANVRGMFLVTAIPAGLVTYLLSRLSKVRTKAGAWQNGIIWTVMFAVYYVAVGVGNGTLGLILGSVGFYLTLVCMLAGPAIHARSSRLA